MSRWAVRPADVVLGQVGPDDRAVAERLMRTEPAFRAEVERLRTLGRVVAATPTDGWEPAPPPALDTERAFTLRAPRLRPRGLRGRVTVPRAPRLAPRPVLAGLVVAAAAAALVVGVRGGADAVPAPAARTVALDAFGGGPGTQRAQVVLPDAPGEAVRLRVSGAEPSRSGEFYELWLLGEGGRLASVGSFRVGADGRAEASFALGADPAAYRALDVSLETDDGDPDHSKRSVLRSGALA